MGFDDGKIELDSPNDTYYAGQTVQGKIVFQQDKFKTFRGLYAQMKGFCKVHWSTSHSRTVDGRTESYTVNHESHEVYFENKNYLLGGPSGEYHLQPGHHELPFYFSIPATCPSSYEGSHGHIRYELKLVVDRAFKIDQEKKIVVRVIAPVDLNRDGRVTNPMQFEFNESYCCCCTSNGSCETVIKLPYSGYCPEENIPIEVACNNQSNVDVQIKLAVKKEIAFRAAHEPGTKHETEVVKMITKGPVPGSTERNWSVDFTLPSMDVYNVSTCKYIDIDYVFEVTVVPSGCHSSTEGSRPLFIGTVPLGLQDNTPNSIPNPMPVQLPLVELPQNQPLVNQPYLNPYPYPQNPAIKPPPYSQTTSPYPTTTPYPNPQPNVTPVHPPYPTGQNISPYPISPSFPNPVTPSPMVLGFQVPIENNQNPCPNPYATASAPQV